MSEELKKRTKKFALDVIELAFGVPHLLETRHAIGQAIRSSSSVAANYRSACRGKSKADFIAKLGTVIDRVHRELTDTDLEKLTSTYHAWRGDSVSRGGAEHAEKKKTSSSASLRVSASPRLRVSIPIFRDSVSLRQLKKSPRTATCSRPAATSAPRKSKTTATPLKRKCPGSFPSWRHSSRSRPSWRLKSELTWRAFSRRVKSEE